MTAPMVTSDMVTGRFTLTLSERELSLILDAVEACMVTPPEGTPWSWTDYATVAGQLQDRLAW